MLSRLSPRARLAVLIAAGLILVIALFMLYQGVRASMALRDASTQARQLQSEVQANNLEAASKTLASLQDSASTAHDNTSGPLWATATVLPFVGDDVDAVRTVSASLDDISHNALPPLLTSAKSLNPNLFKPAGGRINVAGFDALAPSVGEAGSVLARNQKKIDAINADNLIGSIASPVRQLQSKVDAAVSATSSASRALALLPQTLGAGQQQRYLLVFQNNAEARSTGGLPGAWAELNVQNGQIAMGAGGAGNKFPQWDINQAAQLTQAETYAFGSILGQDFLSSNATPDFPRAATIQTEMLAHQGLGHFDGVISVDPVALSYVLKGTGPIRLDDGTILTADNAVDTLMYGVYAKYSNPAMQDAFFQDAVARTFDAISKGQGNWDTVMGGLVTATDQHRVMLWFSNPAQQKLISGTNIANQLPSSQTSPQVGLYLNDSTQSKMQYFLRYGSTITPEGCSADGGQSFTLTSTFESTAPKNTSLIPRYVTGSEAYAGDGSQILTVFVFAPDNGSIDRIELDGQETTSWSGFTLGDRPMQAMSVRLVPGQKQTLRVFMHGSASQRGPIVYNESPGVHDQGANVVTPSSCS